MLTFCNPYIKGSQSKYLKCGVEIAFLEEDSSRMDMFYAQSDFSMHFALFVILP